MSTAPRYLPNYTLEDYQHWEGDWELIDGIPFSISPSPFGLHERIISRLSRMIGNQLDENCQQCEIYTNLDWIISNTTVIRPDLMVVCADQPERHLEHPPALTVEVLSPSTRGRDLIAKRSLCRENHVPNYLTIDPVKQTFSLVTPSEELSFAASDVIQLSLEPGCQVSIDCSQLFDK